MDLVAVCVAHDGPSETRDVYDRLRQQDEAKAKEAEKAAEAKRRGMSRGQLTLMEFLGGLGG